jgi:hypothetical protein
MKLLVNISVRLMVAGGAKAAARSGSVEEALATAARKVSEGDLSKASDVMKSLDHVIAKDTQFQEAFANASVSKGEIARYYLRSLENTAKGIADAPYVPNEDTQVVNLEHVLPRNPEANWPDFTHEQVEAYYRRIGNLALLAFKDNSNLKSAPFADKKVIYAKSAYETTLQISKAANWTPKDIMERQRTLAGLAVKTWPLAVR